ncbi:MAG: O-acetylhomoserine aminocarboxypropyltransferase/cysteine synthase [Tissierellia bacterium]|nr:O-acetylhomoserine aminocarboxypropyltransferase/cysteine synthase [Tissierellia bacterium]
MKEYSVETKCVQAGYDPKNGEPRITPIVQSTAYKYDDVEEVGALFDLEKSGHFYSRISNPTVEVLENKIAALEGGVGALGLSSGQAASLYAVLNICQAGDHIIAQNNIYGGTFTLLSSTIQKMGISSDFFGGDATVEEIQKLIQPNTKLIFSESLTNPGVEVPDIRALADLAHENGIPLIVDNTLATPYLCRPIEHGADIVVHSATKYLDGHATTVAGIIVDSGNFPWSKEKFPVLTEEDPNYHGLSYTKAFGRAAYITRARVVLLRDLGSTMSPFGAFLINLGCETLALRMERHSENALAVAKYLQGHPKVEWVSYPFLESARDYENAKKYLKAGSGVISFGVKGGKEEGAKFINALSLATLVVHVGDIRTCALHPATMTHRQLSEKDQIAAGIQPNMVRLSVGIEAIEDIIQDLESALEVV